MSESHPEITFCYICHCRKGQVISIHLYSSTGDTLSTSTASVMEIFPLGLERSRVLNIIWNRSLLQYFKAFKIALRYLTPHLHYLLNDSYIEIFKSTHDFIITKEKSEWITAFDPQKEATDCWEHWEGNWTRDFDLYWKITYFYFLTMFNPLERHQGRQGRSKGTLNSYKNIQYK